MLTIDVLGAHATIGLRLMKRRPLLAAARALTVALVVTAVTAVFAVANATFLRPLPFPGADRLVRVYLQPPGTIDFSDANPLDPFDFVRVRERTRTLERFEGILAGERAISGDGEPEAIAAGRVSAGFFDLLGGEPAIGRVFTEREVETGARLAVLGHGYWTRRFGGDRTVVGRTLIIDGEAHTIVGVLRRGFEPGFAPSELWTPLTIAKSAPPALLTSVQSIGRVRPSVTRQQALADLETVLCSLQAESPSRLNGWALRAIDLREAQYGSRRPAILMLLGAVGVLALMAIANLANLTLVDLAARRGDFAVRAALGASRVALAVPDVAQSLLLALSGAAAGLLVSSWLVPALLSLDPSSAAGEPLVAIDSRVVLCAFTVAAIVMIAAVVVPVLRSAGPSLAGDLTSSSRATGGPAARRVRLALVTAQTALGFVLLSSGALVVAAFNQAARTDPGFEPANVVTAQLRLGRTAFPTDESRAAFIEGVLDGLRATPGIVDAGMTLNRFVVGQTFQTIVHIEDRPTPDGQPYAVQFRRVSPGYFAAMRIGVLRGRVFERRDRVGAQPVVVVSRAFARRFWPNEEAIGRRLKRGSVTREWAVVIGMVEDVRDGGLTQPSGPVVYSPYLQGSNPAAPVALIVRTAGDPQSAIAAIKRAVWAVDPTQPLGHIVTLEAFMSASLGPQRFRAVLVALCAVLGLLLATLGTYGITARSVVERTREVGIRLALGAGASHVLRAVAWGSLRAVLAGAVAGAAASGVAGALLTTLLPELQQPDWRFSAAAAGTLVFVASVAALAAARGAISLAPLRALGVE